MAESLKFYCDENTTGAIAQQLADKGVDIVRCQDIEGMMGATDEAHFTYAIENDRIILTEDNDFLKLSNKWLTDGNQHPGIFFLQPQVRNKKGIGAVVSFVLAAHAQVKSGEKTAEEFYNQVTYVK
jgi:predicted nuclease of predicted toxin-antitoxin system